MKLLGILRRALWGRWWRKALTVVVALVAVYAAFGFWALPAIIHWQAPKQIAKYTTGAGSVGKVAFNPFTFRLQVNDFDLHEADGTPLVAFRHLDVNFDPSRLIHKEVAFAWVHLAEPRVNAAVDAASKLNLAQLVKPSNAAQEPQKSSGKRPVFAIADLAVTDGHVAYSDLSEHRDFHLALDAVGFHLKDFSTRSDADGLYHFTASVGPGQTLAWDGDIGVAPLRSAGKLSVQGLELAQFWPYVANDYKVVLQHGKLGVQGHYELSGEGKALQLKVDDGAVRLQQLAVARKADGKPVVTLPSLNVQGVQFDLQKGQVEVANVALKGLALLPGTAGTAAQLALPGLNVAGTRYNLKQQHLEVGEVKADGLALLPASDGKPGLAIGQIAVADAMLDLGQRKLAIGAVTTTNGRIQARMDKHHQVDLVGRLKPLQALAELATPVQAPGAANAAPTAKPAPPAKAQKPFVIAVQRADVKNYAVAFIDASNAKPATFDLKPIDITVKDYVSTNARPIALVADVGINGGKLQVSGPLMLAPVGAKLDVKLAGLPLAPFQPYLESVARVTLKRGTLDVDGKVRYATGRRAPDIAFDGRVAVHDLDVDSSADRQPFVRFKRLALDGVHYASTPAGLKVQRVALDAPFARLIINPDRTTNINSLVPSAPAAKTAPAPRSAAAARSDPAFPVTVGAVVVKQGTLRFSDLSMTPNVSVGIEELKGGVQHFSTQPGQPAAVDFTGNVGPYAPVTIKGTINPLAKALSADIAVRFENLGLAAFSPYSGKFAGYRIEKGKANLALDYDIHDGMMQGKNKVVLDQLELGEKVDSPDALHVPLRLALALLKDSHGVIDLDLPVTGDLNDPEFAIGPLILKVLGNVLAKAVTSPFRLLAGLVPGDAGKLDHVNFAAGQAALAPADRKALASLAQALGKRPVLILDVAGVVAPDADRDALAREQVLRRIRGEDAAASTAPAMLASGDVKGVLKLYHKTFDEDAGTQVVQKEGEPADTYRARVAQVALEKLAAGEQIPGSALQQLANARAEAVRGYLVKAAGLDVNRVYLLDTRKDAQVKNGSVVMPLKVNVK
ncbi:MAG: DUF748 domain-containing protein [Nevskiaceae bacterium]|nr:MAG: DUF748 domain-containing protein [Burkholderiaceae bacterium]TBR72358.1 MAG: DUF748 domain-containing protein [Nevskiaceae bacterium]